MEYTAQNLEYAVSVFYNGEQSERARAHTWLTAAQRAPEAWKFVWELLQPNKGTEIQFYAATTLHTKILRCWNELPPESHEELKEKILQAVHAYAKGPKIVTNRLCISLAAFILQQGTQDLATILRPLSTPENTSLLLEVLTVIPEEYNSMTMGSSLRSRNRTALQQACPMVLDDMLRCLQTVYNEYAAEPPSEAVISSWTTAAVCACSWLSLGGDDPDAPAGVALPERLPLCRALLAVVRVLFTWNEAVSDTALDACEACLSCVRAAGGGAAAARFPEAALQLADELAALATPIMQRDNVPNSINEELVSAVITCCVSIVEWHSHAVVAAAEREPPHAGARQLLELLLAGQAAPGHYPLHETRSNLVFGAWYTLQDEVLNILEGSRKIHEVWRDLFSRLLTALVAKSEAHESALSRDDLELLRCYRQDIADTVMYCYGILGEWCWATVEAAYSSATTETRREAALHVFLALADSAPHQRAPAPLTAMLLHAVQAAHDAQDKRTLNTALDCLGSYASWVSSMGAGRGEEVGAACVRAVGAALARCPSTAALALRKLCADCAAPAAALAPDIVRAALGPVSRSDTWVRRQLLGAAGAALSAAELDAATPLLHELARMLEQDMRQQASEPERCRGSAECAASLLGALAARPELAAALFRTLLPTLPAFAQHHSLVEPLFSVLKQTVSTLMDDCLSLVSEIAHLTIAGFNTRPCAAGLDVVKLLVLILGDDWSDTGRLLAACVAATARSVAADPSAGPDLTEALFALLHAITKKKPVYIDCLEDLPQLVELGCNCVRMWEAACARAACAWLAALCGARPAALQPHAPALAAAALRCIGGATPRNQMEPLAELLLALNRAQWRSESGDLGAWLRAALAPPGFPTHHAADSHKHKFIASVVKEKSSKRRLLEAVQEFSLVCRGLIGTEYARQTLASKQLVA
ncbi:importin-13 [Pectinophora gossypiella]|uniref:importin-13 n=1 Tax=Pectinophora gossypiella TaxID=13191 RepID=UPI00214E8EC7|nr:importin-13 [Pectinophora gossypiella]